MRLRSRRPIDLSTSDLRTAFVRFRPALRGQRRRITAAVVLALGVTAIELIKPWPITLVLDHLIAAEPGQPVALRPILIFAAVALAVPVLHGFTNERLQLVVAQVSRKATVRIRSDVFEHMQRLELDAHQQHYTGDLLTRLMGDVNMIRDLLFPSWVTLLSRGSVLIGGAVAFALVDIRLFAVALVPLPLLWITIENGSSAVKTAAGRQRRKEGAIASTAAESLQQASLIKAFSAEDRTSETFKSDARGAERATMEAARHAARMARLTMILTGAGTALVLVIGALRTRSGLLSPGELVLAISYTKMVYKPIRKLTGQGAKVAKATACALRVIALLDQPTEDPTVGLPVTHLAGHIDFYGVSHAYPDGRHSIQGLLARIPAGTLVAVTGENGTGKSTILALLLRLYRPTHGEIHIGGVNIETMQLGSYREQIAYVPQELSLFGGTIKENIAFGRVEATDAEILAAAEAALLGPVLATLPHGIDTVLEEGGTSLSGGQARRIMLARSALRKASVLLLDEPLTGLDPDARDIVARAIRNIAAGRTALIVHHGELDELGPDYCLRLDPKPDLSARHLSAVAQ